MSEITNPYRPGEPVADPAMLFGRQDAADWLEENAVHAPRDYGAICPPDLVDAGLDREVERFECPGTHLAVDVDAVRTDGGTWYRTVEACQADLSVDGADTMELGNCPRV